MTPTPLEGQELTPRPTLTMCDHRTLAAGDLDTALPELNSAARHAESAADTVAAHKIRAAALLVCDAAEEIANRHRERCS